MYCVVMEMNINYSDVDIQSINYCTIFIVLGIVAYICATIDGVRIGERIY
jgi:hypothetical protein